MKREIKGVLIIVGIFIWTLMCVYGTYNNTVQNAQIRTVSGGYIVTYANTGECHYYKWR